MSEESEFYNGLVQNLAGGQKRKTPGSGRLDIHALGLLRKVKWDIKEPPTAARADIFPYFDPITYRADPTHRDDCPNYLPKEIYNYHLASGKITLLAPVIDPTSDGCDIVFYEELVINSPYNVKLSDLLMKIWTFYNMEDPSEDLSETLLTMVQNGGNAGLAAGLRQKASDTVKGVKMNMKVPQTTLLNGCTKFKGLTPVEDGVYYIKLGKE